MYAAVLAPAVWVLCGAGFTGDRTYLLVLAGAAYAVLLLTPISPLGPLIAGLVFLTLSVWAAITPDSYASIWPAGTPKSVSTICASDSTRRSSA